MPNPAARRQKGGLMLGLVVFPQGTPAWCDQGGGGAALHRSGLSLGITSWLMWKSHKNDGHKCVTVVH